MEEVIFGPGNQTPLFPSTIGYTVLVITIFPCDSEVYYHDRRRVVRPFPLVIDIS